VISGEVLLIPAAAGMTFLEEGEDKVREGVFDASGKPVFTGREFGVAAQEEDENGWLSCNSRPFIFVQRYLALFCPITDCP